MTNSLHGVRGRVTFTVLVVSAALYSVVGTVGFVRIAASGRAAIHERIEEVLDQLESAVRSGSGTSTLSTADGVTATVHVPSGDQAGAAADPADPADAVPEAQPGEVQVVREIRVGEADVWLVGFSSQARLTDSLRSLYRGLWLAIPLAAVLTALMAGLATRRALRPVGAITDLAATIDNAGAGRRVPVPDTGDEIERLAVTVNAMLDRIAAARVAQRRFTSDAAHELRTPLMALQGEMELVHTHRAPVDDALLARLGALTDRLGERIDDLVLLSTLDEARPLALSAVDMRAIVEEEAQAVVPPAAVEGPHVEAVVDAALVARAVRNLLANARRHATAEVIATIAVEGARVWLHVDDDGPGIDPADRVSMFERFARLDEARTTDRGGAGLGLAIVASVAAAHGGGAEAGDSPLGGARLSLWLPLSRAKDSHS
jgi:signal transduction histidine kinase